MSKILILIVLLAGCSSTEHEKRYVCDSYATPWARFSYMDDGIISWRFKRDGYNTYYKVPEGAICKYERREVKL